MTLHFLISKTRKNCKFCGLWRGWKKEEKSYISHSIINPRTFSKGMEKERKLSNPKVTPPLSALLLNSYLLKAAPWLHYLDQDFPVEPETNTQSLPVNPQQKLQKHESKQPSLSCWGSFHSPQQLSAVLLSAVSLLNPVCQNLVPHCFYGKLLLKLSWALILVRTGFHTILWHLTILVLLLVQISTSVSASGSLQDSGFSVSNFHEMGECAGQPLPVCQA